MVEILVCNVVPLESFGASATQDLGNRSFNLVLGQVASLCLSVDCAHHLSKGIYFVSTALLQEVFEFRVSHSLLLIQYVQLGFLELVKIEAELAVIDLLVLVSVDLGKQLPFFSLEVDKLGK